MFNNRKYKSFYDSTNNSEESSHSGMYQSGSLQDFDQMRQSLEQSERGYI